MATHSASTAATRARWLICRAGAHVCGLPLDQVVLTMRRRALDAWSGGSGSALGVATVRGLAVPVVSLGRLLREEPGEEGRLLILRVGQRQVALGVDAVLGIRALSGIVDLPPLLQDAHAEHVAQLARLDGELLLLLETGRLLPAFHEAPTGMPAGES